MVRKLSVVQAGIRTALLLTAGFLVACSTTPTDPTANWSTDKIYAEAKDEASTGAFEKAISLYEKLEGRAAGTPLAQQAQLEKAYYQFKAGERAQSVATLDRFMRLNPASSALDYALYLKGLVNFNDDLGLFGSLVKQDLSERDQKAAKESFEAFRELVTRFPASKYAPDAKLRMGYIVNSLAQSEVHVARYYYSRGAYVAAINRAQGAINEFRDAPATEEALHLLVQSYAALDMKQLRDDSLRVLKQNYPQSVYLADSPGSAKKPWFKFW